ncbi:hypothetical protein AB6A40_000924 [Gnathostoma spinigerum]|uniref:Bromo domain-containing protein n=1 Tax=Gnathostoma spinigerum TaxID=75299 RepID=A0ABD6E419_9BILA
MSPPTFPRRSCRDRQTIHNSLDEHSLMLSPTSSLFNSIVKQANLVKTAGDSPNNVFETNGYSTRSKDRISVKNRSSSHHLKVSSNSTGLDDEVEDHNGSRENLSNYDGMNMYEAVKKRHLQRQLAMSSSNPYKQLSLTPESSRPRHSKNHHRRVHRMSQYNGDIRRAQHSINKDVEVADDHERRQYELRNRKPLNYDESASSDASSSSESESQRGYEKGRFGRHRQGHLESRRTQILPINMRSSDGPSVLNEVRERLRESGALSANNDLSAIDQSVGFDQVGGLDHHIMALKEVVLFPMIYPDIFSQFNISPPKGVLFYGPPGTGKTLVARALANTCSRGQKKIAFFMRKGAECLSKWVGESEQQLKKLFEQAYSMRPAIIFFDEIDGLAPARSSKNNQAYSSVVSTLLALMDGLDNRGEVVVIGATNRLDSLDPALRRPGRFDREFRFGLPDAEARRSILKISTSSWKASRPSEDDIAWLASKTSGYCGADLKALCTEAVLVALRERFPQIYLSDDKLAIQTSAIVVQKKDFVVAMSKVVPAAHRDLTISSLPLEDRVAFILESTISSIMARHIPNGYRLLSRGSRSVGRSIEGVIKSMDKPPVVPSARLLLCGKNGQFGQTSYILPVIVNQLDHLPISSLAAGRLFSSGSPEEAFSMIIQSAIRASSTGTPAVVIIPSIDLWEKMVPTSVLLMLFSILDTLTGFSSVLFIATAECPYNSLVPRIKKLFRSQDVFEVDAPSADMRQKYFDYVIKERSMREPREVKLEEYPVLPTVSNAENKCELSNEEVAELKKMYHRKRSELMIHYLEAITRFSRDRRFGPFAVPVDADEVPDYYDYIKNPMDLATMAEKVESYQSPDEFLADFQLIYGNAVEYNPLSDPEGRHIRNNAKLLLQYAQRAVDEIDPSFMRRMKEIVDMLNQSGNSIDDNTKHDASEDQEPVCRNDPATDEPMDVNSEQSKEKPNVEKDINKDHNFITRNNFAMSRSRFVAGQIVKKYQTHSARPGNSRRIFRRNENLNEKIPEIRTLSITEADLDKVVDKAVSATEGWPMTELERLAANIAEKIDAYSNTFDRSNLPSEILSIINDWEYDL